MVITTNLCKLIVNVPAIPYSLQAVAFLHRNLIAHLVNISSLSAVVVSLIVPQDISHENFLMNFWGVSPPPRDFHRKAPILRAQFPQAVKYALIDFGYSIQFSPDADPSSYLGTWKVPRLQRAPETTSGIPFDPFAADVYQTGRLIYGWCMVRHKLIVLSDLQRLMVLTGAEVHR